MKILPKDSLARGAIVLLTVVVAVVILTQSLVFTFNDVNNLDAQLQNRLEKAGELAQKSVAAALWQFNYDYIEELIGALALDEEVAFVRVRSGEDVVAGYAHPGLEARDIGFFLDNSDYLARSSPVVFNGMVIGRVDLAVSREQVRHHIWREVWLTFVLGLMIVASIGVTLFLINRAYLFRPLARLEKAAARIAAGDLDYPIKATQKGEIGQLARSLEVMRVSLGELFEKVRQTDELARLNARLEAEAAERRQVEHSLRLERDRAQHYLDVAGVMLTVLDRNNRLAMINRKGCEILGYREDEIIGRNWCRTVLLPEERSQVEEVFEKLMAGVTELHRYNINNILTKSGEARLISWHNALLKNEEGRIVGLLSSGEDITERVRTERERESLQEQLRQSQKMEAIGTLAGGIAHDFNNILGAIIGYSELAADDIRQGESSLESLEQVLKSANRAKELVNQILTFSRKVEPELRPLDLNHEVAQARDILEHTIPRMIDIEMDLAGDLDMMEGDANQLGQVLINLGVNAADSMPDGGRLTMTTTNVDLGAADNPHLLGLEPGRYVRLEVSDTGHGMDRDTMEHIFDPFFTRKGVGQGTGLGLAMVYGIVAAHRGRIDCRSVPDQGTVFTVHLPSVGGRRAVEAPEKSALREEPPGGSETILLVDDEPALVDIGRRLLAKNGYNTVSVTSGEEALDIFRSFPGGIDAVVLDVSMPGMGGRKCLAELIGIDPGIKVIIASGYALNGELKDVVSSGARGFVAKPFSRSELLTTIRTVLDAD